MFDLLIRNGAIVDGTGNPWLRADVGIRANRVAALGQLGEAAAARVVDAQGLVVAPGFVDAHTHSDFALLYNPPAQSHVAQGITTDIAGNCGYSPFPRVELSQRLLLDREGVEGSWSRATEYFEHVLGRRFGVNVAMFVGHNTVRAAVLGKEAKGPASPEDVRSMRMYVREAMEAGALGLSTGLDYAPGGESTTDELVELCRVVAEYGGMYTSHLRGYADTVLDAVAEAIEIGRRTGVPVQLSHLNVFGRQNWGKAEQLVAMVEGARDEGIDVTGDIMAYPTVGAWWAPRAIFPESVYNWREESSVELENLRRKLMDPATRAALREEVERRRTMPKHGFHEAFIIFGHWGDIYLEGVRAGSSNEALVGRSIDQIAAELGKEPVEAYFDLVVEEGPELNTVHIAESEQDYRTLLTAPWVMFGTDTVATDIARAAEPYNVLQHHPRGYASYPRILRRFVFDQKLLTLPDAIRKMTSLATNRFRLQDRGLVKPGFSADLVLLDPARVQDTATYLRPKQYPLGLPYVLVNGTLAVDQGRLTAATGGRMLTRAA